MKELLSIGVLALACSQSDGGIQKSTDLSPGGGGGGSSAANAAGARSGGAGGDATAGSSGSGDQPAAGAAGAGVVNVDCAKERPGSPMVRIDRADKSGSFCIDAREATQADYAAFLAKVPTAPSAFDQDAWCKQSNPFGYMPQYRPHSDVGLRECGPVADWNPEKYPNRPVACVDWCDASAYCAWAGKRLCGLQGGVAADVGPQSGKAAPASAASEWVYTCAEGDVAAASETKRSPSCLPSSPLTGIPEATDRQPACVGRTAPFDGVQDLEGNAGEWTSECEAPPSDGAIRRCFSRGGGAYSPVRDSPTSVCAVQFVEPVLGVSPDLGFRCCTDLAHPWPAAETCGPAAR